MHNTTQTLADQMMPIVLRYITPTPSALNRLQWHDYRTHSPWILLLQILEWAPRLRHIARARRACFALLQYSIREWPRLQEVLHRGSEQVARIATLTFAMTDGTAFPSHPTFWDSRICRLTGFPHPNLNNYNATLAIVTTQHAGTSANRVTYTQSITCLHCLQDMLIIPGGQDLYLDSANNVSGLMKIYKTCLRSQPSLLIPFLQGADRERLRSQLRHILQTGPTPNIITDNINSALRNQQG